MKLERCPYDSSPIAVARYGEGYVISCDACGSAWEMRGTALHRLRAPDPATMMAVREGLFRPDLWDMQAAATDTAHDAAR